MADAGDREHRFLVHLGYAKAGSSFLQKVLFSGAHPEIGVLGAGAGADPAPGGRYLKSGAGVFLDGPEGARHVSPFAYDPQAARARILDMARGGKRVSVISNEELAGHPFSGGVYAGEIARRIRDTLPDARILIMFREQRAMLLSAFADFVVKSNGRASLARYLASTHHMQVPWHQPDYYCFSGLVGWYRGAFGARNVLALPMEALARDQDAALAEICRFLEVPALAKATGRGRENVRNYRSYAALRCLPWINAVGRPRPTGGNTGWNIPGLHEALRVGATALTPRWVEAQVLRRDRARIEAHLASRIAADNRRLQSMTGHDLAALGYLVTTG
ncbi:hypothetical protein DDZ14_04035 [Maritimibacter sp. 55A14]|uniref:sulfotransferase n=1 Tax=Maritimibacter sp. 55A14 TaxID=2174844 RepID=UPI000D612B22|nr:sulfotransferase [Maritimibacter sp. 55A14]PWE33837.1 hypothetical protein DDZ14_04035 [Maritimibacter sp. 55A14]